MPVAPSSTANTAGDGSSQLKASSTPKPMASATRITPQRSEDCRRRASSPSTRARSISSEPWDWSMLRRARASTTALMVRKMKRNREIGTSAVGMSMARFRSGRGDPRVRDWRYGLCASGCKPGGRPPVPPLQPGAHRAYP